LRYNPGFFLEELRKITKAIIQDNRFSGQDFNPGLQKRGEVVCSTAPFIVGVSRRRKETEKSI
jgi:hypothetical protein